MTPKVESKDARIVHLRWSLWSADPDEWEEYAPGLWRTIWNAWRGATPPIEVWSEPLRQDRFGVVTIWRGRASVRFKAITWNADLSRDANHSHWTREVEAATYGTFMAKIDAIEQELIGWEAEEGDCRLCAGKRARPRSARGYVINATPLPFPSQAKTIRLDKIV